MEQLILTQQELVKKLLAKHAREVAECSPNDLRKLLTHIRTARCIQINPNYPGKKKWIEIVRKQ